MSVQAFPSLPGIMWPVKRSPSGLTTRQVALQGKRTILPQMPTPRWTWELPFEFLRSALWSDGNGAAGSYSELETLAGFYLQQMVGGTAFAYTDDADNAVTAQGFGSGDGATTAFQLVRSRGGFVEPVYLPGAGFTVSVNGTPTVAFTESKGVITFTVAPANGALLTWTGAFAWICRFDEDSLDVASFMSGMSEARSLKFSSEISP